MPKPKKVKHTNDAKHAYDAQVESQVHGMRLVRQQRPPAPQTGDSKSTPSSGAASNVEPLAAEPELVSKLIDFIKTI